MLREAESLTAWQRTTRMADLDKLDPGSIRLLPLLYRRLERDGAQDEIMRKLKGVYRHAWYGNQLRLRDAAVVLGELRRRGTEPMLLKGAALTLLYYKDYGLRPMEDVDILVRTSEWRSSIDALRDLGWRARVPVTPRRVAASHAMEFAGAGAQRIDLHWHLLPDTCWRNGDEEFWERASAVTLHGVSVAVLDPTDQLFHTLAHGVKWEHMPPLRWIVDAAMILNDESATIDWDRLFRLASRLPMVLPLRDGLTHLATEFGLAVPLAVLSALGSARVSAAERWEYRMRTRAANRVLGRLPEHWLRYRRLRRAPGELGGIPFIGYLQVALECDGVGTLMRRAFFRHRWRRRAERDALARARELDRASLP